MVYGLRVGLRTNDPAVVERVLEYLPPGWSYDTTKRPTVSRLYSLMVGTAGPAQEQKPIHILFQDTDIIALSDDLTQVLEGLESDLQLYVAEEAPRRVFVHAGVVAVKGKAILFPGRTLSGKSTLVAELVRAGATYYSDEYAVLDAQGRVHPYARPIALREVPTSKSEKITVESLGGKVGRVPVPVALVIMSDYRAGARWRPRQLSPGEGMLALLSNAVSARRQPQVVMPTLQQVVSRALVLQGRRGDAADVVSYVMNAL